MLHGVRGILACALVALCAWPAVALADPPTPTYSRELLDCVTGNNQFWEQSDGKFHWWVNQAVGSDGAAGTIKCDSYANDQYERPTDQTYTTNTITQKPANGPPPAYSPPASPSSPPFLSGLGSDSEFAVGSNVFSTDGGTYYEYADITRGNAGFADVNATDGWLFFRVELFGEAKVDGALSRALEFANSTYYSVRLGSNANPNQANNGILLRNQRGQNVTTTWSMTDAKVFADTNGDVSGAGGVNVSQSAGDSAGNGYEQDQGNNSWLWVRRVDVPFTGPSGSVTRPAVEFGFNYKKYNLDRTRSFLPTNLTYVELDSTKGLQDNQNYLWNDEYTLSQAGSPNAGEISGGNGLGNIYQLDSLRLGGFPAQTGSISGTKFEDLDADGVKDAGEPGLQNWVIYLDNDNDGVKDVGEPETTTDATGAWSFTGLAPGTYRVREVLQAGWTCSAPSPCVFVVNLAAGGQVTGNHFGNYRDASISGTKFEDLDADGVKDAGESFLAGWVFYLDLDNDGVKDAGEPEDTTDANGVWSFTGLKPDDYHVREVLQAGWTCSTPNPCVVHETLTSNESSTGHQFGNYQSASISGTKFHDLDGDGVKDAGEPGLPNWVIYLDLDNDGVKDVGEPETTTDANGNWSFTGLAPGTYHVREVLQAGWTCTTPTPCVFTVVLISGQQSVGNHFGNRQDAAISGTKFEDLDSDGIKDAGEPGLANWVIYIDANGNDALDGGETQTTTDASGNWSFTGLTPGVYSIREVNQAGWTCSAPAGCEFNETLTSGESSTGHHFGNYRDASISGTKFEDLDADGVKDAGEPGLQNWVIYIDVDGSNTLTAGDIQTTTDASGNWSFAGLAPGTYSIREVNQAGWTCTTPNPCEFNVTVASGGTSTGHHFGNSRAASISGVKFHDLDADGVRDAGEPTLQGWVIYIDLNGNGVRDGQEPFTTTDLNGAWSFTGLQPGTYTVREELQPGWACSRPNPCVFTITVTSGDQSVGNDFGNHRDASISGLKFHDLDASGTRDAGEAGLGGWVFYIDLNGNDVLDVGEPQAISAADGSWSFTGLAPGVYTVREVTRPDWECSAPPRCEVTVTVASGDDSAGHRFGNFRDASIEGIKYHDLDGDGDRDDDEPPLSGWVFYLDENDNDRLDHWEDTSVTDSDGEWSFDDLEPDEYTVREVLKPGWECSEPTPCEEEEEVESGEISDDHEFGNFREATIVIDKVTEPSGSSEDFEFTSNLPGKAKFELGDRDEPVEVSVDPGTYNVAEGALPAGWVLEDVTCTGARHGWIGVMGPRVTIEAESGDSIRCTFRNEKQGRDAAPLQAEREVRGPEAARARLRGPARCVTRPFRVRVDGRGIASVVWSIDGRVVRRQTARDARAGTFTLRVRPSKRGYATRVRARVQFAASMNAATRTLGITYRRCARKATARPSFTG
jgi:protocatechuate 3,4-dioxygenase beta subunit